MKTLLVGINSKYIHTCLAIWYLKASVLKYEKENNLGNTGIAAREFSINDNKDNILSDIYKEKPDVLAFSCYIWNIEIIISLARELKKLLPHCSFILGGPEVSYDPDKILKENEFIDFIISGEGEEAFIILYDSLLNDTRGFTDLKGIAYREGSGIIYNEGFNLICNLDDIPVPYTEELLRSSENRILYYESSRGCPFSCSYCISSTFNGVRVFSMDRVKKDLGLLLSHAPRLIKFVDRTFNCNRQRAKDILRYIISQGELPRRDKRRCPGALDSNTTFHFEVAGDIFDDELLDMLGKAKKGLIQLEIGIQTTNTRTLEEIDRITDIDRLKKNVERIIGAGNIHIHLDLIAGLPYEDLASFKKSFNDVYGMRPHQMQLGFLKLLKGAKVRSQAVRHGFEYRSYAPYEVLFNRYISHDELLLLKDVEEVFERYFNSGRFSRTLRFLERTLNNLSAFEMYHTLSVYCREKGYLDRPVSYKENISILNEFFESMEADKEHQEIFRQHMIFDFLSSDSSCAVPGYLKQDSYMLENNIVHQILKDDGLIKEYLPHFEGSQVKNIIKKVYFINLDNFAGKDEIIMFDYSKRDPVTVEYKSTIVPYLLK